MLNARLRQFSFLSNLLGVSNPSSLGVIVGSYPPQRNIPEYQPLIESDRPAKLELTTLANGVKIFTESTVFPGPVNLGVTINSGSRDETVETSGTTLALAKTYLKSNSRTNEQLNYCIVQMSGGSFKMHYNQEFMFYSGQCLAHDTYDFIQMLSDVILDEKTLMDEEAAHWRVDEYWKLREVLLTDLRKANDLYLTTAYGVRGLGMPLHGFHSNFQNLGYYKLNAFRKYNITPDRMTVWGSGINNHQEFVDAVSPYFRYLEPIKPAAREKAQYLGGEYRELSESPITTVTLGLESAAMGDSALHAFNLLSYVFGKSVNDRTSRVANLRKKVPGLVSVSATNNKFSDSGVFKVDIQAPSAQAGAAVTAVIEELKDIAANLKDDEVTRAKNKKDIEYSDWFNDPVRRQEVANKFLQVTGQKVNNLLQLSNAPGAADVKNAAQKLLKSNPTLVVIGGDTHNVPSADKIAGQLKQA